MSCPQCGQDNPTVARFCNGCGARLATACPACGQSNPAGSRFCNGCGARLIADDGAADARGAGVHTPKHLAERILTSRTALEGERKQVTVLFADLKGSMELLAERDPEDARKLLDPVLERMMDAVHRYEGTVNQVMGDGIMALFGAPLAHEDHAVRACYAALRMQDTIRRYSEELRRSQGIEVQVRAGLNSGDVLVRSIGSDLRMDYTAVGQTTHLAARMEQLALPDTIRLTAETLRLAEGFVQVKPLGPVPVKASPSPWKSSSWSARRACGLACRPRGPGGSRASSDASRSSSRFARRPSRPRGDAARSSPSAANPASANRGSSTSSFTRTARRDGSCARRARSPTARRRRSCRWPISCADTFASRTATRRGPCAPRSRARCSPSTGRWRTPCPPCRGCSTPCRRTTPSSA